MIVRRIAIVGAMIVSMGGYYFMEHSRGHIFRLRYHIGFVGNIAFVADYVVWPEDRYRSSYRLREDSSHEVMDDVLRFVFLELGRFNKRMWELDGVFDKWMYLLKHIHEMVEIPKEFNDSLFTRLFMLSEIDNFTAEEYEQYVKSLENMGDYQNIINTAVEEAEKRGMEKGREEGSMEKSIEIAVKLMATGMSKEEAAAFVGISVESLDAVG